MMARIMMGMRLFMGKQPLLPVAVDDAVLLFEHEERPESVIKPTSLCAAGLIFLCRHPPQPPPPRHRRPQPPAPRTESAQRD